MIRKICFCLFVIIIFNTKIYSQDYWIKTNGPYATSVNDVAFDSSGYVYAGTVSGIYKSEDNGEYWAELGIYKSITVIEINENDQIFAGTGSGIYRSSDYGVTWDFIGLDSCDISSIIF